MCAFKTHENYYGFISDENDRKRYTARIERIRRSHCLQVFYQNVTREEKDLIVKAMGLTQGHWFKCPKGEYRLQDYRKVTFYAIVKNLEVL